MPPKNTIKLYVENGHYHVYNRGVEKRKIFLDEQDYTVFLHYLKRYLSPPQSSPKLPDMTGMILVRPRPINSLYGQIDLLAYGLMPNHFHLLLKQKTRKAATQLLRRICTCYSMYFNKKYNRVGRLFQSIFKGVLIDTEQYLLHLSRYIHLNPVIDRVEPCYGYKPCQKPIEYPFSSYANYLGERSAPWLKTDLVLSFFKTAQRSSLRDVLSYQSFVEDYIQDSAEILGDLTLEA